MDLNGPPSVPNGPRPFGSILSPKNLTPIKISPFHGIWCSMDRSRSHDYFGTLKLSKN